MGAGSMHPVTAVDRARHIGYHDGFTSMKLGLGCMGHAAAQPGGWDDVGAVAGLDVEARQAWIDAYCEGFNGGWDAATAVDY